MKDMVGIVLAAGEGTRMKSNTPKVLHKICGKPMLKYMLDLLESLQINKNIVIVGHQADKVKTIFTNKTVKTVTQPRLLGSGDAVWQTRKSLSNFKGDVLIVYGDTPLVTYKSLNNLIQAHRENQAACTILTAQTKNPTGFGRIIRSEDNHIVRIIEEQDADPIEKAIGEINVGVYCFKAPELFPALEEIKPNNAKKEYYLTDAIKILTSKKAKVESVSTEDEHEAVGVNSRLELSRANGPAVPYKGPVSRNCETMRRANHRCMIGRPGGGNPRENVRRREGLGGHEGCVARAGASDPGPAVLLRQSSRPSSVLGTVVGMGMSANSHGFGQACPFPSAPVGRNGRGFGHGA